MEFITVKIGRENASKLKELGGSYNDAVGKLLGDRKKGLSLRKLFVLEHALAEDLLDALLSRRSGLSDVDSFFRKF